MTTRHDEFVHIIDDPKAPDRLKGLEVKAILTEKRLDFEVDMPDDPTPNELGYMRWFTGELVDKIQEQTGIGMNFRCFEEKKDE